MITSDDLSGRGRSSFMGLTQKTKPVIEITIDDEQQHLFAPSYTTLDRLQGTATVTCPCEIDFEEICITFQGLCRTYVEKVATSAPTTGRTQGQHYFLRLVQPIESSQLPENNIMKAGERYTFPFTFVVPERLLPQSCAHPSRTDQVQEEHMHLPPTFGDTLTTGDGVSLKDDMAPDMSHISYGIRAIITRKMESGKKAIIIADQLKRLRIIPAVEEAPPLSIAGGKDDDYKMRKEKDLRKGLFKGKLGRLTVEAVQPKSMRLPTLRAPQGSASSSSQVGTMAVLNLRFDPAETSAQPPRLGCLIAKLKVNTFFSSAPFSSIPTKSTDSIYDTARGLFIETIPLHGRNVESASWTARDANVGREELMHHDSTASNVTILIPEAPAEISPSPVFYTAQVLVPITLPTANKSFVPTFHSCLVSRTYTLDLQLSVHSGAVSDPQFHLKVPLQISVEANPNARPMISEAEAQAIRAREAAHEDLFAMLPPSPDYEDLELTRPRTQDIRVRRSAGEEREDGTSSSGGIGGAESPAPPGYREAMRTRGGGLGMRRHGFGLGRGMGGRGSLRVGSIVA